jgi:Putative MetA-pathway of phenol degradation
MACTLTWTRRTIWMPPIKSFKRITNFINYRFMRNRLLLCVLLFCFQISFSQDSLQTYKKGSYLFYGQPNIEDNSMFIEEAFDQERAIIQHISNLIIVDKTMQYVFTQEIPLPTERHQLSVGILYNSNKNNPVDQRAGFGDLYINYRSMLMGKTDWALVIPRFTVIVPTGNAQYGFGSGGWGAQFNMAVTKRLNSKITTHWNAGATRIFSERYYDKDMNGVFHLSNKKHHNSLNLGLSAIYLLSDSFNFLCEYTYTNSQVFNDTGTSTVKATEMIVNPGFRFAFNAGITQIVPGLGIPLFFENGKHLSTGTFIYLSIEPNYLAKK